MKFKMVHENYNVKDLDASLAFYKEALGLTEVRYINATDGSFIIVFLEMMKVSLSLNSLGCVIWIAPI